jgi:hypothetical protein
MRLSGVASIAGESREDAVGEYPEALTLILVLDHSGTHGNATEGDLRVRSEVVVPSGVPRIARVRCDDDNRPTIVEVDDRVPAALPALGTPRFEYRGWEDERRVVLTPTLGR